MNQIRVLFFVAYPQRMAGANRSLLELVGNLPDSVRPLVIFAAEGAAVAAFREAGIPCRVLRAPGVLGRYGRRIRRFAMLERLRGALFDLPRYTVRLRRIIRDHQADLVHVNDPRGLYLAWAAARISGCPIIAHLRGEFSHGRLARWVFETGAARILTVSEGARATLSPRGRKRAVTVYNGIRSTPAPQTALPWIAALRREGVAVMTCFASVVPFKGHHHLIGAMALLRARGWTDDVILICVGDLVAGYEFYYDFLAREMARLDVRNVVFAGWQDDPYAFYAHTDFCVLASVSEERLEVDGQVLKVRGNEGFPRANLEAMSLGLPVVATSIAGVPEQVEHGVTGLLVSPSDEEALAEGMEALLSDRDLRQAMANAGRERVRRLFSTEAYVGGVTRVYSEALSRPARRAAESGDIRAPVKDEE